MAKKTAGYVVLITEGVHKDKRGYAFYMNQSKETIAAKKAVIVFEGESEKKIVAQAYCKVIGFVD